MNNRYWDTMLLEQSRGRFLCVGLDPQPSQFPLDQAGRRILKGSIGKVITDFNEAIVTRTSHYAAAYKPNLAFYIRHGTEGVRALIKTVNFIHEIDENIPVILDGKFGDIGNTNDGYAEFAFSVVGADAVTIHPYLGSQAMKPFLEYPDRGVYVLCRTSNPGAEEFQDLAAVQLQFPNEGEMVYGRPEDQLYMHVATTVRDVWNRAKNCGLVVGATYPEELRSVREFCPDLPFLIPGIGKQGGDLQRTIEAAVGKDGTGQFIINVSSAICHASTGPDFAQAAGKKAEYYHLEIRRLLDEVLAKFDLV